MSRAVSIAALYAVSAFALPASETDAFKAVDPFWGSGGTTCPPSEGMARGWNWEKAQTGNTHPGATRPFGWVSVCAYSGAYSSGYGRFGGSSNGRAPEISNRQWAWGFTHFHGSGTGDTGRFYNYFRFEPSTPGVSTKCRSRLDDEVVEPGYYAAKLTDYRTAFELTAAPYGELVFRLGDCPAPPSAVPDWL